MMITKSSKMHNIVHEMQIFNLKDEDLETYEERLKASPSPLHTKTMENANVVQEYALAFQRARYRTY